MANRRDMRQRVIALVEAGYGARSAGRLVGVPGSTAARWVHRYQNLGEVENRPIPGRPRISSLEEDALLFETVRQDPFLTANEIRAASNFPGSSQTVISRLRNRGIRSRRAAQMEILGEAQAVDRLAFATNRVDFDWRNVIFSDETTISSDYEGPVRVYREDGLRHDQRYVHRRERSGRFSISCWGWMSYDGPGVIERIDGRFNAGTYEHILENIFLPSARERFPEGTLLFQQDNHPVHYAASIQRWFQRRPEIEIINWPPKSPDLNVIENLWAELKKRRIATYAHRRPRNRDELWDQVVDTWEDLAGDQNLFHNLVTSMPDRLRAVIEADGMWTRF